MSAGFRLEASLVVPRKVQLVKYIFGEFQILLARGAVKLDDIALKEEKTSSIYVPLLCN